jgi:hypothetical protein
MKMRKVGRWKPERIEVLVVELSWFCSLERKQDEWIRVGERESEGRD